MADDPIRLLIRRWPEDGDGTYQNWFLWPERLKNFRSIRRGLEQVVSEMKSGTFGSQYRGSSLETVVKSIAEQRQIFKGLTMPFSGSRSCGFRTFMSHAKTNSLSRNFWTPARAAMENNRFLRRFAAWTRAASKGLDPLQPIFFIFSTRRSFLRSTPQL